MPLLCTQWVLLMPGRNPGQKVAFSPLQGSTLQPPLFSHNSKYKVPTRTALFPEHIFSSIFRILTNGLFLEMIQCFTIGRKMLFKWKPWNIWCRRKVWKSMCVCQNTLVALKRIDFQVSKVNKRVNYGKTKLENKRGTDRCYYEDRS